MVLLALWLADGMAPVEFFSLGFGSLPGLAWKRRVACGGGALFSRGFVMLPGFAWKLPAGPPALCCALAWCLPGVPPLLGASAGAPPCSCATKLSGGLGVPGCVPLVSLGFGSLPGAAWKLLAGACSTPPVCLALPRGALTGAGNAAAPSP